MWRYSLWIRSGWVVTCLRCLLYEVVLGSVGALFICYFFSCMFDSIRMAVGFIGVCMTSALY